MTERISVADRMNRLPVTGFTRVVCGCIFIGWMCEAIDLGITSFMLPTLFSHYYSIYYSGILYIAIVK